MARFQPIDELAFERASARAKRDPTPFALSASFDRRSSKVRIKLNTGLEVLFDPRTAYGLENASEDDISKVEVEGAGGALRFPRLDADFSIPRLLEGFLGPLDWARREQRALASRENGKLGGRPKKAREREAA